MSWTRLVQSSSPQTLLTYTVVPRSPSFLPYNSSHPCGPEIRPALEANLYRTSPYPRLDTGDAGTRSRCGQTNGSKIYRVQRQRKQRHPRSIRPGHQHSHPNGGCQLRDETKPKRRQSQEGEEEEVRHFVIGFPSGACVIVSPILGYNMLGLLVNKKGLDVHQY